MGFLPCLGKCPMIVQTLVFLVLRNSDNHNADGTVAITTIKHHAHIPRERSDESGGGSMIYLGWQACGIRSTRRSNTNDNTYSYMDCVCVSGVSRCQSRFSWVFMNTTWYVQYIQNTLRKNGQLAATQRLRECRPRGGGAKSEVFCQLISHWVMGFLLSPNNLHYLWLA